METQAMSLEIYFRKEREQFSSQIPGPLNTWCVAPNQKKKKN